MKKPSQAAMKSPRSIRMTVPLAKLDLAKIIGGCTNENLTEVVIK